jgi:hypothetical protein
MGCLGRAAPQIAHLEVPAVMIPTPAKRLRHDKPKTLLAAGRPLRRGEGTHVYFDDVRRARGVQDRFSFVPCSAADECCTL